MLDLLSAEDKIQPLESVCHIIPKVNVKECKVGSRRMTIKIIMNNKELKMGKPSETEGNKNVGTMGKGKEV